MLKKYFNLFVLVILSFICKKCISQEVELVISSGMVTATDATFSNDNQVLATMLTRTVRFWDIKTGREIRTVTYTDNYAHSGDSIYFSNDNRKLWITLFTSYDKYSIEVESGKVEFVKSSKVFDFTTYKYVPTNDLHLYSTSMKDLVFSSPDKKIEVIFRKVKNPAKSDDNMIPYVFHILFKQGGKEIPTEDTTFFSSFAFSTDSKLFFSNSKIYELSNLKIVNELNVAPLTGTSVAFLPGTHIPVTCGINNIRIWDFPGIKDIAVKNIANFYASPNYDYLVCQQYTIKEKTKNYITLDFRKQVEVYSNTTDQISSYITSVSDNAEMYATLYMVKDKKNPLVVKYLTDIVETKSGAIKKTFDFAIKAYLPSVGNHILLDSMGITLKRYDFKTKKVETFQLEIKDGFNYVSELSNNGKYLMGYNMKVDIVTRKPVYSVRVWDAQTGKIFFKTIVEGVFFSGFQMSHDNNLLAFSNGSDKNRIYVYNVSSGKLLFKLKGHSNHVPHTAFSDDNKRLLSGSYDGMCKLWNLEKGIEIVSLISTGEKDYAIVTPDQYYYCTKGANKNIHYVKGKKIFPFQQFDLKFNRPDIITERLLSANIDLIRSYNLAYKKRLKRMGFTEDMLSGEFHLPELIIENKSEFPVSTESSLINLKIGAFDSKYKLDRLIVKVNDVPIYGKDGIELRSKNIKNDARDLNLILSTGANKVSVSVLNEKGVESLADNLNIKYIPLKVEKPDLYLFTMGVSKYKNSAYNLTYAAKDANDVNIFFTEGKSPFGEVFTENLTDAEVTESAIKTFKEKLKNSGVDDVVCIFYAGHGLLDADLNYYLGAYDVNFEDPSKGGIQYETIEEVMDAIPARNKLILLDACHSGEIDKDEVILANEVVASNDNISFRAMPNTSVKKIGLNNSFELMKELFTDIRKSSGTMIISSAGGTEFAMEGDQWNNGIFTYCLLNGLKNSEADLNKDNKIMMTEINSFVRKKVIELTNGMQNPTTRAEVIDRDWRLR